MTIWSWALYQAPLSCHLLSFLCGDRIGTGLFSALLDHAPGWTGAGESD
jgi:hypothetical protein